MMVMTVVIITGQFMRLVNAVAGDITIAPDKLATF